MAMVVNHNIPALSTYNVINNTSSALQKSINKLSTGLRINSAADDAAGLAISEKMRAQVRGLDQAVSNSQDGISMIQTAEGALSETHSILQRMRELSVQAANDTLTQQDRGYIQEEVDQLREEITRIGNTTQFNKKKLLNGDAAVLWSSSDNSTKAIVNGGLRQIDQFGQKKSVEGNYNIKIKAEPGQGEVQKTDIFKIKHPNVVMNKSINGTAGVKDVSVADVPAGSYSVKDTNTIADAEAVLTGQYGVSDVSEGTIEITLTDMAAATTTTAVAGTIGLTIGGDTITGLTVNYNNSTTDTVGTVITAGTNNSKDKVGQAIADAINNAAPAVKTQMKGKGLNSISASYDADSGKLVISGIKANGTAPEITLTNTKVDFATAAGITSSAYDGVTNGEASTNKSVTADMTQALSPTVKTKADLLGNADVLFEVTDVDTTNNTVTLNAKANILSADGTTSSVSMDNLVIGTTETALKFLDKNPANTDDAVTMKLDKDYINTLSKGSKFVFHINADAGVNTAVDTTLKLSGSIDPTWENSWEGGPLHGATVNYGVTAGSLAGKDVHLKNFYLNEKTGEVAEGDVILSLDSSYKMPTEERSLTTFDAAYIGKVAKGDVQLRDLDKFWDTEGNFMLEDPQTITITQGDGKQTSVTLYGYDTLNDVAKKLNNAVATGLGQGQYVDDASKFVTFVEDAGVNSESVEGTFLIRSVVSGSNGQLTLSGNEGVINAFSLNTIQNAKESNYTATITDAHSGATIASNVQVTGNKLIGVINPNVDVEFDSMAGVTATWDDNRNAFTYNSKDYTTTLHLSDNTTVFQIGANEGEDMGINIGDMRSHALGLDSVLVTDRQSAARSITVIDNAIDKVSSQRAKLGAYQNRLEHTINNLTTASENLTAAESRIRDTDMAKEMMNFSKLQIMLQAGNSMLAQANQLPQNVLSLVR